jgi:hypothetical protein
MLSVIEVNYALLDINDPVIDHYITKLESYHWLAPDLFSQREFGGHPLTGPL